MIVKAVALWKEGVPLEDLSKRLYEHRKHLHTWFAVDDLGALIHGGRLGKVAGFFAGALKIKPVMILDGQGKLALAAKAHGRVKAIEAIASAMRSTITPEGRKLPIYCDYGEDASLAAEVVRKAKEEVDANLIFFQGRVSPVIGIHTGPSIIAVTWYGTEQEIGGN